MSIVMPVAPPRRNARRTGIPIALLVLQACWGGVPGARAEAPARVDEAGPGAPDPAAPRVSARDVAGEQGTAIPLQVEVRHRPGRSGGSTYILGLPKGARLSDADHAVTTAEDRAMVEVTDWKLANLAVTLQPEQTGAYTLAVAALSLTETGRPLPIARSVFTLRVQPRQERAVPAPAPAPAPTPVAAAPVTPPAIRPAATAADIEAPDPAPAQRRAEAAVARTEATAVGPAVGPAAARAPGPGEPPAPTPQAAAPPSDPQNAPLLARAERLIRSGDISGAQLVLEHLVARGDARATFLLAQTCDPKMLRAWRVHGLRPDPERASALYARAAAAGLRDPKSVAEAAR
ncbi:hypothetical protein [Methylobacterium radiodurans]|uniref:Uncharacterized protein n=1 Tax=Methylobacterium radiodurans TaxID=2202828 RepID=A0A2U8VRI8_9HYPH|nr:hypothetical protein [Methylobacterium radiodurans]AWN36389.1 hypothetical protein DK427_12165 [Methylobacterium radiodurans]